MQPNPPRIPALPGVTRELVSRKPAVAPVAVDLKKRKKVAWALAGIATAFLVAGTIFNPAFLVIGGFLAFGAFLCTRPPAERPFAQDEIRLFEPTQDTWAKNVLVPGTHEYEMRHRLMKWD